MRTGYRLDDTQRNIFGTGVLAGSCYLVSEKARHAYHNGKVKVLHVHESMSVRLPLSCVSLSEQHKCSQLCNHHGSQAAWEREEKTTPEAFLDSEGIYEAHSSENQGEDLLKQYCVGNMLKLFKDFYLYSCCVFIHS